MAENELIPRLLAIRKAVKADPSYAKGFKDGLAIGIFVLMMVNFVLILVMAGIL